MTYTICERNAFVERRACSLDETAELPEFSRELAHDLTRTRQLGSLNSARRRLIDKNYSMRS